MVKLEYGYTLDRS